VALEVLFEQDVVFVSLLTDIEELLLLTFVQLKVVLDFQGLAVDGLGHHGDLLGDHFVAPIYFLSVLVDLLDVTF